MQKKWCKIIRLDDQEVMINLSFHEGKHIIITTFYVEDKGTISLRVGPFDSREEAQQKFFNLSKEDCTKMFNQIMQQIGAVEVKEES